jgi:hypothetical protein
LPREIWVRRRVRGSYNIKVNDMRGIAYPIPDTAPIVEDISNADQEDCAPNGFDES